MTPILDVSARAAIQITRAAPLFDRLAAAIVEHCASLDSSQPSATSRVRANADPDALRGRLDWFFPKFRDLYFNLLGQHIGPDLPAVLGALNDESVQCYLRALESMRPALERGLQQLGQDMLTSLEDP